MQLERPAPLKLQYFVTRTAYIRSRFCKIVALREFIHYSLPPNEKMAEVGGLLKMCRKELL